MKRILGRNARHGSVDGLRLRLLAAVGGVTVTVACGGTSVGGHGGKGGAAALGGDGVKAGGSGVGGDGGKAGTSTLGGDGGKGGAGALGGDGGKAGTGTLGCLPEESFAPGFESCKGGYVHRPEAMSCEQSPRTSAENGGQAGVGDAGAAGPQQCVDDFDCKERLNGHCLRNPTVLPPNPAVKSLPFCLYSCETDADCAAGDLCACLPSWYVSNSESVTVAVGECVSASCKIDGDCTGGAVCVAPISGPCGGGIPSSFHCQSPNDECSGSGDCPASPGAPWTCDKTDDHYVCSQASCGRPFLVQGALRHSELVSSEAWLDAELARGLNGATELDETTLRSVAEHFAKAGLMEHASIAAFARFTLQLLALGAPPELVQRASEAMADETRHAELCFALASRYAGHGLGPSPLDVSEALGAIDLLGVVDLVVDEGCIGETTAALEAAWAAQAAADPDVRAVLLGIAEDEARHAELAFAFVAWAARRDVRVLERVEAKLGAAMQTYDRAPRATPRTNARDAVLAAHGVLPASTRLDARRAALQEILPALAERLGAANRASDAPLTLAV
jgi:hypothetical protein